MSIVQKLRHRWPYHRVDCAVCAYWCPRGNAQDGFQQTGCCRRRAPVATAGHECGEGVEDLRKWPMTFEADWCGDGVLIDRENEFERLTTANTLQTKPNTE